MDVQNFSKKVNIQAQSKTLKAKQLEELKLKEDFKILIRFTEKNTRKYYKTIAGWYFLKS